MKSLVVKKTLVNYCKPNPSCFFTLGSKSHPSKKIKLSRKSFRLCHGDEYGTFSFGNHSLMLKTTSLYHEKYNRTYLGLALDNYNELVRGGMLTWED